MNEHKDPSYMDSIDPELVDAVNDFLATRKPDEGLRIINVSNQDRNFPYGTNAGRTEPRKRIFLTWNRFFWHGLGLFLFFYLAYQLLFVPRHPIGGVKAHYSGPNK